MSVNKALMKKLKRFDNHYFMLANRKLYPVATSSGLVKKGDYNTKIT